MKLADLLPPGVKQSERPSKLVVERLQRLAEYDLSFLTNEFTEDKLRTFSPEQLFPLIKHFKKFKMKVDISVTRQLEFEFKRFVAISLLKPGRRNAPSGPVDMYWHFFVLHTAQYVGFCTAIFGMYGPGKGTGTHYGVAVVDHEPATESTRPEMNDTYRETRAIYESFYLSIDEKYWPKPPKAFGADKPMTCGDSYSGFIHPLLVRPVLGDVQAREI
jgi:hypothetical protein